MTDLEEILSMSPYPHQVANQGEDPDAPHGAHSKLQVKRVLQEKLQALRNALVDAEHMPNDSPGAYVLRENAISLAKLRIGELQAELAKLK